jgi:hypothetical protein
MPVLLTSEIDWSKLTISEDARQSVKAGVTFNYMSVAYEYSEGNVGQLMIQTPMLEVPFGLSPFPVQTNKDGTTLKDKKPIEHYDISLNFNANIPESENFKSKMQEFDDKVINVFFDNPKHSSYLNMKKITKDALENIYSACIKQNQPKPPHNKVYHKLKISLPSSSSNGEIIAYDPKDLKVYLDKDGKIEEVDIMKVNCHRCQMSVIMCCTSIWIVGIRFGASWKPKQILIKQADSGNNSLASYSFRGIAPSKVADDNVDEDDDEDEDENEKKGQEKEKGQEKDKEKEKGQDKVKKDRVDVYDEDDEDEDDN